MRWGGPYDTRIVTDTRSDWPRADKTWNQNLLHTDLPWRARRASVKANRQRHQQRLDMPRWATASPPSTSSLRKLRACTTPLPSRVVRSRPASCGPAAIASRRTRSSSRSGKPFTPTQSSGTTSFRYDAVRWDIEKGQEYAQVRVHTFHD